VKLLLAAMLLVPVTAVADPQGAGAPAPPKNAPVDKKAPAEEPTKPTEKAPAKDKPVDKPAGDGSGSVPAHKPVKSPARHA